MKMNRYYPKPFRNFGGNINVKVDLSNYATNGDLWHRQSRTRKEIPDVTDLFKYQKSLN